MKKPLLAVLCLSVLLTAGGGSWLWLTMQSALRQPLALTTTTQLVVPAGTGLANLSRELVNKGWISNPYPLIIEGRRRGLAGRIKVGEYAVQPGTTPLQLLEQLVAGKVVQHSLTLLEGWTVRQILDVVAADPYLAHSMDTYDPRRVMEQLGYPGYFPEGRFFPDTYYFPAATPDREFLLRAFNKMQQILAEEWAQRAPDLPYRTAYEALILASIIEKETGVEPERELIAGVFVRRLQRGMKLQTDPTVIYAVGDAFDGDLRRRDLHVDSAFNTYRYRGLPPTPIAAPGRASIHAALHPGTGTALYFVAKGDGSHHFSTTLKEHQQAVKKYQLGKR